MTRIDDFLRTGESNNDFRGNPVLCEKNSGECGVYLVRKNMLYYIGCFSTNKFYLDNIHNDLHRSHFDSPDAALFLSTKKGQKFAILMDGDDELFDRSFEISVPESAKMPTISYCCLAQLMGNDSEINKRHLAVQTVAKGKIKVVDFEPDEARTVDDATRKMINKFRSKGIHRIREACNPPQFGFTLMQNRQWRWHRSATILLRSGKETWLVGQDEGTYFGVVLADHPTTIKGAYDSLVPKHIRKVRGLLRQGEWFAIPVDDKKVPKPLDCFCVFDENAANCSPMVLGVAMPKDDPESNDHLLTANEGRVSRDGMFARGFEMQHDEHADLCPDLLQWYTFARNTAKRSVSMDGVD